MRLGKAQSHQQRALPSGFTLVELMVGMTVGLLIIFAVTVVYLSIVRSSAETLAAARLNHDVRAAMTVVTSDLRRAGYWNRFAEGAAGGNPWGAFYDPVRFVTVAPGGDCVRYGYDYDHSGAADADEHYGFRLVGGALQMWNGAGAAACDAAVDAAGWELLIGDSTIEVTQLLFSDDDEAAEALLGNRLRVLLEARRINSPEGVVRMALSEIVFLRNSEIEPDEAEDV